MRENMGPEKPTNAQVMYTRWFKTFVSQASTLLTPMILSHGLVQACLVFLVKIRHILYAKKIELKKK